MTTLIEKSILNERLEKSRSGTYADTSENRRKHRVGQKYGSEKKEEEKPEKTDPNKMSPEQQLEAINKVIAAVNEGKLKLPPEEINTLVAKKTMAEEAAKKQAEKINAGVKANEEKKNAEEAKETSKKINEAQKKESEQKESTYEKADRVLKEAPIGAEASGGGYGPFKKEKVGVWINKVTGRKFNGSLAEHIGGFSDFAIKKKLKEEVNNLQRRKELSEKVERLISEKKKKFPNPDIESPMSDEEKRLTKEIADTWSEINKLIQENRKSKEESKSEPKQGETEESYTRVKFDDVPNSGKVNLKKYLSEKVRQGVDEKWSNIKNIPTDNLKKMEKGLVNDLNKNFEAIKKSQRAELLYSIMKVKGELESRGKETQKKE